MSLTPKNWSLNSYSNNTWTDLVAEAAIVASVVIPNTSGGDIVVELKLDDGAGTALSNFLPPTTISSNASISLDLRSLNVTGAQKIMFRADVAGAEPLASGVV